MGLPSIHILWFNKKHLFSCLFKIQSGHELWSKLLAGPKIKLFPPFSSYQASPPTWFTIRVIEFKDLHPAKEFQPQPLRSFAVYPARCSGHTRPKVPFPDFTSTQSQAQTSVAFPLCHWNFGLQVTHWNNCTKYNRHQIRHPVLRVPTNKLKGFLSF